jgi:flagellar biosynthesis protein FlhG
VVGNEAVRKIVESALDQKNPWGIKTPLDLLAAVEKEDPEEVEPLKREINSFHPRFVVNQVRGPADVAIGHQLVTACARHLGIRAAYGGYVEYDDTVWQCVRQRRLFMAESPRCRAAEHVARLARGLVEGETLTLPW